MPLSLPLTKTPIETGSDPPAVQDLPEPSPRNGPSHVTVVIPAFNEEVRLPELFSALVPELDRIGVHWSLLVVDDGSGDNTLAELRRRHEYDPRVTGIALSRNFGKEMAIAAGLRYAQGDAVVVMDADLQHPPAVISDFVAAWRSGYDVVLGRRDYGEAADPLRRFFSRAFYRMFRTIAGTEMPSGAVDFLLLDRKAVDALNRVGEHARFNKALYSWIGYRSTTIPFRCEIRNSGASRWSFVRLAQFALDGLVSFSNVPLKVWSYVGLLVSALALAYALYFLVNTLLFGGDVPGFPSLIVSVMFFSGIQLISLGVIGEYLARVYEEVKSRPLFLVSEKIGIVDDANADADGKNRTDR